MRNVLFSLFFGCMLGLSQMGVAQSTILPKGPVYTATEIPKVHITIDPDSLDTLYLEENWYDNYEYSAIFEFETESGIDSISPVGFRFRGNTSRDKLKKSFKVSFNTFAPGGNFHGFEKLNLNAEVNDVSMLRSRLNWELFRELQIPAPRSNHVEVYINGDYYGLYQNTEHIDEEFAEAWFGNKKGNLYKCTYPANLQYISEDPEDYKMAPWGTRTYELKTNNELDDYSDLAEFISFLNLSSDAEFECGIADRFNVYNYLKIAAADVLTGNWDGYIYNQNNFYLYNNPITGRFEYIPYDLDNTWGIDWLGQDWAGRSLYAWSTQWDDRPLYDRLMDAQAFRDIFSWHVLSMLNTSYASSEWESTASNLQDFILASAIADPYRPLDFGFDETDFINALSEAAGGHVDYGIFDFASERMTSAFDQLGENPIAPVVWGVEPDFSDFPNTLHLLLMLDGPEAVSAQLNYSIDGVQQTAVSLNTDVNPMQVSIVLPEGAASLAYNFSVTGTNGLSRNAFCESRSVLIEQNPARLLINEVMSSNASTIADAQGDYDDWIELYNGGVESISLSGFFLSDNDHAPKKWPLPDVAINPGAFQLFWADGNMDEGPNHANFNISASGETLYLFQDTPEGLRYVDQVTVPEMDTDRSYGREVDAALLWVEFTDPTPNSSNGKSLAIPDLDMSEVLPYPVPTRDVLYLPRAADYRLYDPSGRLVMSGFANELDLSSLSMGIYILEMDDARYKVAKEN